MDERDSGERRGVEERQVVVDPVHCAKADGSSGISGSVQFHLDSDKWAVVKGFELSGDSCKPIYQVNLDSASCN